MLALGGMVRYMRPSTCDEEWLERARDAAEAEDTEPVVRTELLIAVDTSGSSARVLRQDPCQVQTLTRDVGEPRPQRFVSSLRVAQSSIDGSRRSPVSSIGKRSSFWRSIAAPISPANSGCGRVGRERSSGWAWVET